MRSPLCNSCGIPTSSRYSALRRTWRHRLLVLERLQLVIDDIVTACIFRVGKKLNIIMEYVPGNSLDQLLSKFGKFNERVVRK